MKKDRKVCAFSYRVFKKHTWDIYYSEGQTDREFFGLFDLPKKKKFTLNRLNGLCISMPGDHSSIIRVRRNCTLPILVHEISHAVDHIFTTFKIDPMLDNGEARADIIEQVFASIYKEKLRNAKDKQKRISRSAGCR